MVSTRGLKIKFAEGEKVLCYEPDPAKTKVLYDSKVLSIDCKRDKNGKKVYHFLIHFQGWSSSWDRIVTEDLILKDTEENRQLQKELADRAQLIARGGNLYRRERKCVRRSGGGVVVRRSEQNGDEMSQPSDSDGSSDDSVPVALLPLPDPLRLALEYDEMAITTQNKVLNLPAEPNITTILESFLKDYAQTLMKQVTNRKVTQTTKSNSSPMTVDNYCRSMNLCREVVDGVRVYIDFILPRTLLYRLERGQLHAALTKGIEREYRYDPNMKIKVEEGEDDLDIPASKRTCLQQDLPCTTASSSTISLLGERRRSLRSATASSSGMGTTSASTSTNNQLSCDTGKQSLDLNGSSGIKSETGLAGGVGRALTQREQEVLDKILGWSLVPDRVKQTRPPYPSMLYGAIHLTRALLRLPELLQKSDYSEAKMDLVLDFLNSIVKYLEDHPHWFGEREYRENIYPPPPSSSSISSATTTVTVD